MKDMIVPGLAGAALLSALAASSAEMTLEWNAHYDTSVPYEVEISPAKLERLGVMGRGTGFAVRTDGKPLRFSAFEGKAAGTVDLRFAVPKGTRKLTCEPGKGRLRTVDVQQVDNLFAGALSSPAKWKAPAALKVSAADGGLLFHNTRGEGVATIDVAVPENLAGRPVRFEIALGGRSRLTWANRVWMTQFDASGKELPEPVIDPRWQSHMRPPDKDIVVREEGRFHPQARSARLFVSLRNPDTPVDNYGMPLKDRSWNEAKLLVTRLALRGAAALPFPRFCDSRFAAGVSGEPDDSAIALGGDRAFWYATRSSAVWAAFSENVQQRDESLVFFPSGAGTCEAWFRPASWPKDATVTLFEGSHHNVNRWKGPQAGRRVLFEVSYRAGRIGFYWKDMKDREFRGEAACELPAGAWSHVACQWTPGGRGEIFVNGRRALEVALDGFAALDLVNEERPNDCHVCECYLGSSYRNSRNSEVPGSKFPIFDGAVDLWRVSTGARYRDAFTPAKALAADADTRALFTFDRSFDGVSGGGARFVSGTSFALTDRVAHELEFGGRTLQYWPKDILPENDPRVVLDPLNYPRMPTVEDFHAARTRHRGSFDLKPGDTFVFEAPKGALSDYVQIENTGSRTLLYPTVLNAGDIDPRSFGDIADTLCAKPMDDRGRVNRVFQFLLGASDYFMNHNCIIRPGTEKGDDVEYMALKMLNGYCGFECGPLNNMAANLFACSARCPSGQTGGYGHSFEQVFYDGKNHIYDLSAQEFFPAMDNETAAYLGEDAVQPGIHNRLGSTADHFIRMSTRSCGWVQTPSYQAKVAMTLRPGERFRVWFDNNGKVNNLQCSGQTTRGTMRKEDYTARVGAVPGQWPIYRINRFFPHYGNGFLEWRGRPTAANPAFTAADAASFCYDVKSCYPIVFARYVATLKDGSVAKTRISGDGGRSWRDLPSGDLDYEVMSRQEYLVKVMAPMDEVADFSALTEVMVNVRIFPGRLRDGRNTLTFKAEEGDAARVTLQCRANARPIVVRGGVYSGAIPGAEKQVVLLDPAGTLELPVEGLGPKARVKGLGGVEARLRGDRLVVSAGTLKRGFGGVRLGDGNVFKDLTVLVCANARLVTASEFRLKGSATLEPAGADRVQPCAMFRAGDKGGATVPFARLPAGRYSVMTLNRFPSHPDGWLAPWLVCRVPGAEGTFTCGAPANDSCNFFKARFGQKGGRANFKWDYAIDPKTTYYCRMMNVFEMPAAESVSIESWSKSADGVELAAVLVVPTDDEEFYCDLIKMLSGLNTQPLRVF